LLSAWNTHRTEHRGVALRIHLGCLCVRTTDDKVYYTGTGVLYSFTHLFCFLGRLFTQKFRPALVFSFWTPGALRCFGGAPAGAARELRSTSGAVRARPELSGSGSGAALRAPGSVLWGLGGSTYGARAPVFGPDLLRSAMYGRIFSPQDGAGPRGAATFWSPERP
jgi:hypothetical protein